jgi:hypothetical protein
VLEHGPQGFLQLKFLLLGFAKDHLVRYQFLLVFREGVFYLDITIGQLANENIALFVQFRFNSLKSTKFKG